MNAGMGWLPKPATRWVPQVLLFASRIVVSATNNNTACLLRLNSQLRMHSRASRRAPPRGTACRAIAFVRRLISVNQGCCRRLFHSQHPDRPALRDHGCDHSSYVRYFTELTCKSRGRVTKTGNANGNTNVVGGVAERTDALWVENLPLAEGPFAALLRRTGSC